MIIRTESKYLIDESQLQKFLSKVNKFIEEDKHYKYTVYNIYYEELNKELTKSKSQNKLRLKSYGNPTNSDNVYIEVENRQDDLVYKRSLEVDTKQAYECLNSGYPLYDAMISCDEIDNYLRENEFIPKLFLAYERIAYNSIFGDCRITFDMNLRSRTDDFHLCDIDSNQLVLKDGYYVMEIKSSSALPEWLTTALKECRCIRSETNVQSSLIKRLVEKAKCKTNHQLFNNKIKSYG